MGWVGWRQSAAHTNQFYREGFDTGRFTLLPMNPADSIPGVLRILFCINFYINPVPKAELATVLLQNWLISAEPAYVVAPLAVLAASPQVP